MVTMISILGGSVDLSGGGISLYGLLFQGNVLWYGHSILRQIMPEYFVLFTIFDKDWGLEGSRYGLQDVTHDIVHKFFHSQYQYKANLPALFAFPIDPRTEENHLKGYQYCWFCAKEYKVLAFSCSSAPHCPAAMMEAYLSMLSQSRRDIPWMYFKKGHAVLPLDANAFCPLTLQQNSLCLADEIDIVASFLTEGSNRSGVSEVFSQSSFPKGYPCLKYSSVTMDEHPISVIPAGRSVQFRFITADGIQRDLASFATFAAPFSGNVWLALGCATIFLAVCIAAVGSLSCIYALPGSVIQIAAPLVEKVVVDTRFSHAASTMMTCWIFVAIVVTTCYKSMMKSNYMIEQKYTTRWKSFKEIENFTLVYAESIRDEVWRSSLTRGLENWKENLIVCRTGIKTYDHKCVLSHEHLFWQTYCFVIPASADERSACEVFWLMVSTKHFCLLGQQCPDNANFKMWLSRRTSLLWNMANHSRIRGFGKIRRVIREELLQPRTAFVSPAETFDADWKIFEEESNVLGVRFSHSEDYESFGSMFGFQLTSGFNEHVGNAVHQRGEMLMESGIFWLWKKWEMLRRVFNSPKVPNGKTFVELSFRNSDLHLTFGVYVVGVFIALLFVGVEYFWYRGSFKMQLAK